MAAVIERGQRSPSDPNSRYFIFRAPERNWGGLSSDSSKERIPPNSALTFTNLTIKEKGVPETVNGCTLKKAFDATYVSAQVLGYFESVGEDFVVTYHANGKVRIWTYPDWALEDTLSPTFTEKVWIAQYNNEIWCGNMAEGIYRYKPDSHEDERRGSAPFDIISEVYEEGEYPKSFKTWKFAYDYELNGGRSALSRSARVDLFHDTHKIKLTVDTPPSASKNRRIYAAYSSDNGANWEPDDEWYFIYEETDNSVIEIILDDELVLNDERLYTEDLASNITPLAKYGISYDSRLITAYHVDNPHTMRFTDVGKTYFDEDNIFDFGNIPTNLIGYGDHVVVTTPDKWWRVWMQPNKQEVIPGAKVGAFRDSLAIGNGLLLGVCDDGVAVYDGDRLKIMGDISSIDFTGLEKPTRFFPFTTQQDFNRGTFYDPDASKTPKGISSDFVPGGLALQPNLREVAGLKGIIDRCQDYSTHFGTGTHLDPDYFAQKFQVPGSATNAFSLRYIGLYMKAYGTQAEKNTFEGEIRADDSGEPNMDATLATFSGKVDGGDMHWREFELSETVLCNEATDYWLVIPAKGEHRADWWVGYRYGGLGLTSVNYYPQGAYLQVSEEGGDPGTWDTYVGGVGQTEPFMTFYLKGSGTTLISSADLADYENDSVGNSDDADYAQRFYNQAQCQTVRGEIMFHSETGSPSTGSVAITIEGDDDGAPDGVTVATASSVTKTGNLIRFNFDTQTLSDDTWYHLIVDEVGDGDSYWAWAEAKFSSGNTMRIKTNGSWGDASSVSMWCKIFADSDEDDVDSASEGNWFSPEITLRDTDDDFDKIYCRKMVPTGSTVTIYKNEYIGSYQGWTKIFDSEDEENYPLPNSVTASTTKLKLKVKLELGDSNYTPIVDSLLVTYTKADDSGDLLHAGTVNGEYWISRDDADADSSDTFTLVFNKFGIWSKLSECFYDYLQIGEKNTLGIGANSTETYRHLYKLDDSDVSVWYSGDTTTKAIATTWETGWLLYDYVVKHFRRLILALSGDDGESLSLTVTVSGAELSSIDDATETYTDTIYLNGTTYIKTYPFSLPMDSYSAMKGKWIQLKLVGSAVDWYLHNYEIEYWEEMRRNVNITKNITFHAYSTYTTELGVGVNIKTFNRDWSLSSTTVLSEPTGSVANPYGLFKDGDYFYFVSASDKTIYKYDSDFSYTGTSYDISGTTTKPINLCKYAGKWYVLDYLGANSNKVYEFNSSFTATGNSWTLTDVYLAVDIYKGTDYWYVTGISSGGESIIYRYKTDFTYTDDSYNINSELSGYCYGVFKQGDYWYAVYSNYSTKTYKIYKYDMSWEYTDTNYDISDDIGGESYDALFGVLNVES